MNTSASFVNRNLNIDGVSKVSKMWNENTIKIEFRCKYFSPQTITISDKNLQNDARNSTRSGNLTKRSH